MHSEYRDALEDYQDFGIDIEAEWLRDRAKLWPELEHRKVYKLERNGSYDRRGAAVIKIAVEQAHGLYAWARWQELVQRIG